MLVFTKGALCVKGGFLGTEGIQLTRALRIHWAEEGLFFWKRNVIIDTVTQKCYWWGLSKSLRLSQQQKNFDQQIQTRILHFLQENFVFP